MQGILMVSGCIVGVTCQSRPYLVSFYRVEYALLEDGLDRFFAQSRLILALLVLLCSGDHCLQLRRLLVQLFVHFVYLELYLHVLASMIFRHFSPFS